MYKLIIFLKKKFWKVDCCRIKQDMSIKGDNFVEIIFCLNIDKMMKNINLDKMLVNVVVFIWFY